MKNAIHRTPCLETAPVKMLLNGPESFTPDGNFILGEAPELRGYFVCAGFNSAGIANSGGAGRLIAEWVVGGEAPSDLWDVDIRRFGAVHRQPQGAGRAHRRDAGPALRDALAAAGTADRPAAAHVSRCTTCWRRKGAEFGSEERLGARQLLQARAGARRGRAYGLGRPGWLDWVIEEQRATREAVALYDQSSFGKLLLQGRDALAVLQRLCANEIDMPVDRMVYTALLNERGGFESDLTVIRARGRALPDRHRLGAAGARCRLDPRHIGAARARGAHRRQRAVERDLGDGPEGARAAGARQPRRPVARRR